MKILLDAGHGAGSAHNRGSVCSNEGDNNYHYSLVLKKELEKIKGVKVDLTRNKISDNPSLASRAAKGAGYDLFMSLHSNGAIASVRGTEIYDSVARPNKALADKLVKAIAKEFGHRNRGTKYRKGSSGSDYYGVLRGNKAKSSMIVEHGFHSNPIDCQYFKNNHQSIAKATADVIRDHYSLSGTPSRQPTASRINKRLAVDGYWGPATTRALQKALGTPVDAVMSGQYSTIVTRSIYNVSFTNRRGSTMVIALQKKLGIKEDGLFGVATVRALQKYLGTYVDGVISKPSPMVRELQRRLNAGTF